MNENQLHQAEILVRRLARLSADSIWARRASGLRASLDKAVQQAKDTTVYDEAKINHLIELGFQMLEKAAQEIPAPEDIIKRNRH